MIAAGLIALAMAALPAQPGALGKLDRIVLDAINRCEGIADAGEIRVCGHGPTSDVAGYRSRFRQAEAFDDAGFDPGGATESASRERHRLVDAGAAGTGSCSAVGAGGYTGCKQRDWQAARQQYGK